MLEPISFHPLAQRNVLYVRLSDLLHFANYLA